MKLKSFIKKTLITVFIIILGYVLYITRGMKINTENIHIENYLPFLMVASIIFGVVVIVSFIDSKYHFFKMWKESGLSWLAFHPYWGLTYSKIAVDNNKEKALAGVEFVKEEMTEEEKRKVFKDFLTTCPTYCIQNNFFSGIIRGALSRGGARFKKVVLIDSSSVDDIYLNVPVAGDYFISNVGFYLIPWDNSKTILYWDINDSRPLIDKSKEAKWQDPRMNARYVYGIMNKISMQGKSEPEGIPIHYFVIGIVLILVAIGYSIYSGHNDAVAIRQLTTNISERLGGI